MVQGSFNQPREFKFNLVKAMHKKPIFGLLFIILEISQRFFSLFLLLQPDNTDKFFPLNFEGLLISLRPIYFWDSYILFFQDVILVNFPGRGREKNKLNTKIKINFLSVGKSWVWWRYLEAYRGKNSIHSKCFSFPIDQSLAFSVKGDRKFANIITHFKKDFRSSFVFFGENLLRKLWVKLLEFLRRLSFFEINYLNLWNFKLPKNQLTFKFFWKLTK